MGAESDAQNDGRRRGRSSPGRRAVVEKCLRIADDDGLDCGGADDDGRRFGRHVRSFRSGRRRLADCTVVRAAVVFRGAADLRSARWRCGVFALLARAMVTGRRARCRFAYHRAHGPRDRQAGQNSQENDGDAVSPLHGSSIPRLGSRAGWGPIHGPHLPGGNGGCAHNVAFLSLSALAMTETELKVMAALAIIGLSSSPKNG